MAAFQLPTYGRFWVPAKADTRRARLEDCLNDIAFGFARAAERKREQRLANQRREQEQRDWERTRLEKMEAIRLEEDRIEGLTKDVDRWYRSQLIRAYVAAFKASPSAASVADLDAWAQWHWLRRIDSTR